MTTKTNRYYHTYEETQELYKEYNRLQKESFKKWLEEEQNKKTLDK